MEIYVFLLIFGIIFAAFLGFLYGKKVGKKMAKTDYTSLQELSEKEKLEKLTEKGSHNIQKYDMVTVLFADIVGFSEISDSLDPEILLEDLNEFFLHFDQIIDNYNVEKIKTMGDAYMCAGGISQKNQTNPVDVVMLALDVQNHQRKMMEKNPKLWSVRVGIHTGPVIAGMLGEKKLSFDIWGHTVNMASRLETSCEAGKINISEATYEKVKKYFDCEYNGKVLNTVDNISSYLVKGLKSEFYESDINGNPVLNHAFFVQMQLLRLIDLEEYVASMIKQNSENLYFHNFEHIMDVYEYVELLAHLENVEDEDVLFLKTAALMHDIGYAVKYERDITQVSEEIARAALPNFQYKPRQIDRICELMKAAHYRSTPNDFIGQIMHDANHMYFGRAEYNRLMMGLLRELNKNNVYVDKTDWLRSRSSRLVKHQFYTKAATKLSKMFADQQITNLEI